MHQIRTIAQRIKENIAAGKQLFSVSKKETALQNRRALLLFSGGGALLSGLALTVMKDTLPGWRATGWDLAFLGLCCLCFLVIAVFTRRDRADSRLIETACIITIAATAGISIGICVCSYPEAPAGIALFVPLCAAALIFLPPTVMLSYLLGAEGAFLALTLLYKTAPYAAADVYMSLVVLLLSLFLLWRMTRLRVSAFRAQIRYQRLSTLDALTGILNKSTCEQYCKSYLAMRHPEEACALLVIDLDDFKAVNDTLGHRTGDGLLEAVGSGLVGCFRSSDVIGRIGGDEFLILLKDVADRDFLAFTAKRIQKAVETVSRTHIRVQVSCSIGIAYSTRPSVTYDDLFLRADAAMYEAKKAGKRRFFIKSVN